MSTIDETLAVATEHHRAGRIGEAERLYRDVLAISPGQPDALHLLGVLALQSGRPADAVDLITQAVAGDDGEAMFHANLGHALHAVGRHRDAALAFARGLVRLCNAGESWANVGALTGLIRRYDPESRRAAGAEVANHYALGDVMRRCSLLFYLTGDLVHYEELVRTALAEPERFTVASLHYAYWGIAMQLFRGEATSGNVGAFSIGDFRRYYRTVVEETRRRFGVDQRLKPAGRRGDVRRVALITNQMLSEGHQPTVDAFDFARRLQDEQGLDVLIVNANAMAITAENGFVPEYAYNVTDSYTGMQMIGGQGSRVRMVSFPDARFDEAKVHAILDEVERFDPDAIVAFGGANTVADLFAYTRAVVCLPTSSGLPPSLARIVLGWSETDTTAGWPAAARQAFRPFGFGWSLPPTGAGRTRAGHGLPEGGPLFVVVGNRLDAEVTDGFLDTLDQLLTRLPEASIAFAGAVTALPARVAARPHGNRMISLGHVEDIRALYRIATALINPPRQGGGASVAYALAEGLPVITPAGGDGAAVAGPAFIVAGAADIVDRAAGLAADPALHARQAEDARARFAAVGDRRRAAERLLGYCRDAADLG